jgi:hypothetical protein
MNGGSAAGNPRLLSINFASRHNRPPSAPADNNLESRKAEEADQLGKQEVRKKRPVADWKQDGRL